MFYNKLDWLPKQLGVLASLGALGDAFLSLEVLLFHMLDSLHYSLCLCGEPHCNQLCTFGGTLPCTRYVMAQIAQRWY